MKTKPLTPNPYTLYPNSSGFTLVELFIVVTVVMILSSVVILYGKTNKEQMFLFQDQSKIIGNLNRAKFLSLQAYKREFGKDCGYGVHFEPSGKVVVYKDRIEPGISSCFELAHNFGYSAVPAGPDEKISSFDLNPAVKIKSGGFTDAVFVPPIPQVVIKDAGGSVFDEAVLELTAEGSKSSVKVKINKYGQIMGQ